MLFQVVQLCDSDIDFIQSVQPKLLAHIGNSFLSWELGAFYDIASPPNPIAVKYFRYGKPASSYIPDLSPPTLLHWNISIATSQIDFVFNKRVNCSKTNISQMVLQSTAFVGTLRDSYTLSAPSISDSQLNTRVVCNAQQLNDARIRVVIGLDDMLNLKNFPFLAKSLQSTNLRFLDNAVMLLLTDITAVLFSILTTTCYYLLY
jgi:hypothetical protein